MHYLADTDALVADGTLTTDQASIIQHRSRQVMVSLSINTLLCAGIIAAAFGFVFWLANALAVAISGALFLGVGVVILRGGSHLYSMFGNAAALIGAGMLSGGATIELIDKYPSSFAAPALVILGAIAALIAGRAYLRGINTRFVSGSVVLMGVAMHLIGMYYGMAEADLTGWPVPLSHLYATILIASAGAFVDVRAVTALAIMPFAQMLDTSTYYFHASYVFYSPESTLSILQMALLIFGCIWVLRTQPARLGRHAGILAIMGFIFANLCALVGSLWGDVVGSSWGPSYDYSVQTYEEFQAMRDAFAAATLVISEHVYSILWAIALAASAFWAAHKNGRGLFNTAMTFGGIHAYTQVFESFYDQPLAYVVAGLSAIPLAWGLWRLNDMFREEGASL
jgi:hypothetical protein